MAATGDCSVGLRQVNDRALSGATGCKGLMFNLILPSRGLQITSF
jgi:hypothetical protein